jgi:hypothetical protein
VTGCPGGFPVSTVLSTTALKNFLASNTIDDEGRAQTFQEKYEMKEPMKIGIVDGELKFVLVTASSVVCSCTVLMHCTHALYSRTVLTHCTHALYPRTNTLYACALLQVLRLWGFQTYTHLKREYDKWEDWMDATNSAAPRGGKAFHHSAAGNGECKWVFMNTQNIFVESATNGAIFGTCLAFVVILLATRRYVARENK